VKFLLDSHSLLWFVWDHHKLSPKARDLMANPRNELLFSMASLWEIAIKVSIGKLRLAEPYDAFMNQVITTNHLIILPITVQHATRVVSLPFQHRDPFDRLLVAQAMVEKVPIISCDSVFDAYPVTRLWEASELTS
jgi:PIN domain nuclease of toxin-antitoxin system